MKISNLLRLLALSLLTTHALAQTKAGGGTIHVFAYPNDTIFYGDTLLLVTDAWDPMWSSYPAATFSPDWVEETQKHMAFPSPGTYHIGVVGEDNYYHHLAIAQIFITVLPVPSTIALPDSPPLRSEVPAIFPNPSQGIINFRNLSGENNTLTLADMCGRKVKTIAITNGLNCNLELPAGMYIYTILSSDILYSSGKLIID